MRFEASTPELLAEYQEEMEAVVRHAKEAAEKNLLRPLA
jgi:hypothetical protein